MTALEAYDEACRLGGDRWRTLRGNWHVIDFWTDRRVFRITRDGHTIGEGASWQEAIDRVREWRLEQRAFEKHMRALRRAARLVGPLPIEAP